LARKRGALQGGHFQCGIFNEATHPLDLMPKNRKNKEVLLKCFSAGPGFRVRQ
jgi:hypothetical protein